MTRRLALALGGATALAPVVTRASTGTRVAVIGAGVFGAWTAEHLRRAGHRVTLVEAHGPAHARASSGGESRMTRAVYGDAEIYTRMALDSLPEWRRLSASAGQPVFTPHGVLFFFQAAHPYADAAIALHQRLKLPTQRLDPAELRRRFPQFDWSGVAFALFEPEFGGLMARRAVQTLVAQFAAAGGNYRHARVAPPDPSAPRLTTLTLTNGDRLVADAFVFACGPWLPVMFPGLLGGRITPTRQEVFFFAPPAGDARFQPAAMPGWADFNGGDIYYGFPDLEARGVKIAADRHGPPISLDSADRQASAAGLADVRAYIKRRFPALADAPLNEARVCQYENSANGDLLIDRHPAWPNVILAGAGSGHGFKHGPEVGRRAAALLDPAAVPELRFSLATKGETAARAVH